MQKKSIQDEQPEIIWSEDEKTKEENPGPITNQPISDDTDSEIPVNTLGEVFLKKYKVMRDISDSCYLFNGLFWEDVTEKNLRSKAMNCDTKKKTSAARRKAIVDYALDSCTVNNIKWNQLQIGEIAFKDYIYTIETGQKREHSWEHYLTGVIPHNFRPKAKCPLWEECLNVWFETEDKKLALQEFFGYILCLHASYKKALLLLGESDTGKSIVCQIAKELVGFNSVCCISLEAMDDPQKLAPIKGKMLNLVTELSSDAQFADGGFKQIISNEPIQVKQLYVRSESIVPVAKHIIATNTLPMMKDSSQGVINRLLLIKFNNIITNPDKKLLSKLKEKELDGIINWAVQGAKRLISNGGIFTEVEESKSLLKEYKTSQNPLMYYIENSGELEVDPTGHVLCSTFIRRFNAWNGGREFSANRIGRMMSSMRLSNGEMVRSVPIKGERFYKGLKWVNSSYENQDRKNKDSNEGFIKNVIG